MIKICILYGFFYASKYFYFLNYLTEWELVTRNNPFLSTALKSQTASVMLLQLSLFSSSLQLHLTALNIVAFCSTGSCSSQITLAALPIMSLRVTAALSKAQTQRARQVRLHGQGRQEMQNTGLHKGSFSSASPALQSHCSPVLMYQWLSPLTMSSKDFTMTNLSQSFPLDVAFDVPQATCKNFQEYQ